MDIAAGQQDGTTVALSASARAFGLVVPDVDRADVSGLRLPADLALFTPSELLERYVVQRDADGDVVAVEAPAVMLGMISTSTAGREALSLDAARLGLFFEPDAPERLDVELEATSELFAWLTRRLAELSAAVMRDTVQVRRSMAVLRQEHSETLERFGALEDAVGFFTTPKRVRKLHYPPSRTQVALGAGRSSQRRVRQTLPMSPTGLGALELHVGVAASGKAGGLRVTLFVGEDSRPLHQWYRPADEIRVGWMTLMLDRAATTNGVDVMLQAEWEGSSDQVSLTLGGPSPLQEYGARADTGVNLGAPLALRAWGMVPGVKLRQSSFDDGARVVTAPASVKALTRVTLASNDLDEIELLRPEPETEEFKLVDFRPSQMDVLVHPVNGHATIAIVRGLSMRDIRSLSALVVVDNAEAQPVEFGLTVVEQRAVYADPESLIERWTIAEPMIYAEVQGTVPAEARGPLDLLIATRMADGADSHLAWAYVKRVEVVV